MTDKTRRKIVVGMSALATAGPMFWVKSAQAQTSFKPEKGAKLRVLRWKRFVQSDEDVWMANTKKFSEKYGIEVRTDHENWEDVRPKAAVAANVGAGPDIIVGWLDDPHLYPEKLVDLTDLAEYLGTKYGGWFPAARTYGTTANGRWIGLPLGAGGALLNYRVSWVKEAGFDKFPTNFDDYLKLCQALQKNGHPAGFALSHATGDSETWMHNVLWGFGGRLVDEKNQVAVNSPETIKAIEYMQQLSKTFIEGTAGWSGVSNNNAFLEGKISLTSNGISIYYAAKTSTDPKVKEMAADINHANMPIGPIGRPTEFQLFFNQMIFKYTKYPKAAKEYLRFMMEAEQVDPWVQAAIGYVTPALRAYEKNPIWTSDPKHTPYRNSMVNMVPSGNAGKMGYASAGALSDFIIVNMVAEAASGSKTPKKAAERAQKRAERYYKV